MIREAGAGRPRCPAPTAAAVLGLVAALILGALPAAAIASGQDAPDTDGSIVGLGAPGEIAFALVSRIERRESSVTVYGFLTHVAGLSADELFTDPANPAAETARFTVFGTADPEPRVALDAIEVATSTGELSIYYNPPAGARFEAAEAFFSGTRIATGALRLHEVFLGDAESERIVDLFAEVELTDAATFALENGDELRFGATAARLYVLGNGVEPPAEEGASRTTTTFAGRALVALSPGPESPPSTEEAQPTVTPEDEPGPTEPADSDEESTLAADVDCQEIEPWLTGTLGRVARSRALVTLVTAVLADEDAEPFAELDPAGLREAADELNQLADAQEAAEAPSETADAHRLLVSAFQTFARGLNLLATAVANENEGALEQARTLIGDAEAALAEGSQLVTDLAAACGLRA